MRIWWCQEHECQAPTNGFGEATLCWRSMRAHGLKPKPDITDCRMVPMRLIPEPPPNVNPPTHVLFCPRHWQLAGEGWSCPRFDEGCNLIPMRLIPDPDVNLRQVERRLYLKPGTQADVVVLLYEPLGASGEEMATGVTFMAGEAFDGETP